MVQVGRVYEQPDGATRRVLVDRLWPRGVRKDDPRVDAWLPQVAPSTELRRWYGHRAEAFEEFADRYAAELAGGRARRRSRSWRTWWPAAPRRW